MAHSSKSKHEYNKPQLKEQIDAAMQAFLKSGRAVERVPTVTGAEAATVVRTAEPPAQEEET